MTNNTFPGDTSGLEPRLDLVERLTTTEVSPELIAQATKEVFNGFELPNGHVLEVGQRKSKDGFVSDDKDGAGYAIYTPAEGTPSRPILKLVPGWVEEPGVKSPRGVLHPFVDALVMLNRKAYRNLGTNLVAQTPEGRSAKKPVTEALITFAVEELDHRQIEEEKFDDVIAEMAEYFESKDRAKIEEVFLGMLRKTEELIHKIEILPEIANLPFLKDQSQ